ncbi:MAG: hypothetical protein WC375_08535 [Methanomassiliicoccales archaeon]|jgi:hypothetical protein
MKWHEEIEAMGFEWSEDDLLIERAISKEGIAISILAFEDDEYEVSWIYNVDKREDGKFTTEYEEAKCNGMDELRQLINKIRNNLQ